ncbi:Uncharacterised protein [Vibrio cholerae]|uniref:Uncharacterized protein n=1 Tax=Vibrio cholerae TaxID=666 RepID=A0A655RS06_VIBCL|nr:Uncharacterised protein [Vibrio cholerae]
MNQHFGNFTNNLAMFRDITSRNHYTFYLLPGFGWASFEVDGRNLNLPRVSFISPSHYFLRYLEPNNLSDTARF